MKKYINTLLYKYILSSVINAIDLIDLLTYMIN